jgi:hypothetical protein
MSKNLAANLPNFKSSQDPVLLTEIQNYWNSTGLPIPASAPITKQTIANAYDKSGYKIFKSPNITDQDFAIAVYAPGIKEMSLACCNKSVTLKSFENMFIRMWKDNTPAVVEVGIVSGGFETEAKIKEVLNYLEGRNNVKIKFYLPTASAIPKALAIDTLGNFSTYCKGIEYDNEPYNDFNHLLTDTTPFSVTVIDVKPVSLFEGE